MKCDLGCEGSPSTLLLPSSKHPSTSDSSAHTHLQLTHQQQLPPPPHAPGPKTASEFWALLSPCTPQSLMLLSSSRSLSNKPPPPTAAAAVAQRQQRHHRVTPPRHLLLAPCRQPRPADRLTCKGQLDPLTTTLAHMDLHVHDTAGQAAAAAGWPSLLLTCALMFLGAYGCGMLPGWLPNQQRLTASVSQSD